MNERYPVHVEADTSRPATPLVERMDTAIGEATTVMGAMMTEFLRRTLRGGVMQIGEELNAFVAEKVDVTLADRTPAIEQAAAEVADHTARAAATEVAHEEAKALEARTRETTQQLATRIEETAKTAQLTTAETARDLAGRIEEAEKKAEHTTVRTARDLTARIEETHQKVQETTQETAQRLSGQIQETEKRVSEAFQAEIGKQVQDILERSRKGKALLTARLDAMESTIGGLGRQVRDEQGERRADHAAVRTELEQQAAALLAQLQHEQHERRAAADGLRQEMLRVEQEGRDRLGAEIARLVEANQALTARVAELEKPRGLRALLLRLRAFFARLFGRGKKVEASA